MYGRLGALVSRRWLATILVWLVVVICLRGLAPPWDQVTQDGDLAFLPADMPSAVGERLQAAAFPAQRAKSQVVIVFARDDQPLTSDDRKAADRFAARFHNYLAVRLLSDAAGAASSEEGDSPSTEERALAQLDEAIRLDPQQAWARHNRAILYAEEGKQEDAQADREVAWRLDPELREKPQTLVPAASGELPLVDVWTRHHEVFGTQLRSSDRHSQLVVLQLGREFLATENIRVVEFMDRELAAFRQQLARDGLGDLQVGISGSAAVGGDMLRAAAQSIQNTEVLTIALVLLILLVVYRAPLMALVPLLTIAISLMTATAVLALLARWAEDPARSWLDFHIFKTTKIFIVVILYGSGTDFCLFLIARYREAVERGLDQAAATREALANVGEALTASALTTAAGLGMMLFADYGKFRNSGPAIALCVLVTLMACLTLAPAFLRALGAALFWPFSAEPAKGGSQAMRSRRFEALWDGIARAVVLRPGLVLVLFFGLLMPLAWRGAFAADRVTFDLLNELPRSSSTYRGNEILRRHFPVGESGPLVVLAQKADFGFNDPDRRLAVLAKAAIFDLTGELRRLEGVLAVRSLTEPLGDPPQRASPSSYGGLQRMILQEHRLVESLFLAQAPEYRGQVTRFELVLKHDPFSREAMEVLSRVDQFLDQVAGTPGGFWSGAAFSYAGTTAGIRDLQRVTRSDQWRIQVLVVLAVFLVLMFILRRPGICLYLMFTVVLSYLVTVGITEWYFAWLYGESYRGLDWKVPIFLFVILVAVGEDYNIYLITRVLEEQATHGPFGGLRRAIASTGGIISSCGVIMAGSFIAMTSGTLRGIVELGFALALGIILDTFLVRPILVPAWLALLCRWRQGRQL